MRRLSLFSALVAVVLMPLTAQAEEAPAFLSLDLEQAVILPSSGPVEIHVLIRIQGAPSPVIDNDDARNALNLGLTLDTSGSMDEARKWEYALEATNRVIDRLDTRDRLSISTYANRAKTLAAQDDLKRPGSLKRQLAGIRPDGGTNISAGLKNNARILAFGKDGERLSRIILMSDGLANDGIQDQAGMKALVARMASDGTTISTIGLGADYDEAMLRSIAEAGKGNYYYVESPAQASNIFDQEVRGLFQIVAEDLKLNLVGAPGVEAELLNSITFAEQSYDLGSLRHDESIVLIAKFDLPRAVMGEDFDLGSVQVSLKERETGRLLLLEEPLTYSVSEDGAAVTASLIGDVRAERTLVEVEAAEKEAAELAAKGDYEGAGVIYEENQARVQSVVGALEGLKSFSRITELNAKDEALFILSERMAAPAPEAAASLKSSNQSLFYASKGQRKLTLLQEGDRGFEVENLQRALDAQGYAPGDDVGEFNDEVEAAIRAFQADQGLTVDGIAGPATLSKLGLY